MRPLGWISKILLRLRYPVTLPEEIATDIGVSLTNFLSFDEFVRTLTNLSCRPRHLKRFMPRDTAEAAFQNAQRKEIFGRNSLFFYYFSEGWLEFSLHFDEQSRLRRVYLRHKQLPREQGVEILLNQE